MTRRVRSFCSSSYNKYLKPGALAQLRDSRFRSTKPKPNLKTQISIRRVNSLNSSASSLITNGATQTQISIDGFPCFAGRIYGPRCTQRKKIVAAKSIYYLSTTDSSPESVSVSVSPESLLNVLNSDLIVSH
ncbi:hypothetical protein GIB67_011518 [Kingdonia uniflora]|uniref:Uncharacterized protein n=1 Tax=Kingdonia uniflora TaxID=39325 RepID=A0A7J7NM02_9MAGN|nr:hypothetical protein GIB67_011518 [Kingdonia uniflora]